MPEFHIPRLSRHGVRTLLPRMDELLEMDWRARRRAADRWTTIAQLGARKVTDEELDALVADLQAAATSSGLGPTVASRRSFDITCAELLSDPDQIPLAEGLRDDVWAWIATVLCPDLVHMRFGQVEERFQGGVRNTFQRLWMRGSAFREPTQDQARLLNLTEDAHVQVFERPGLSASIRTARLIADHWSDLLDARGPTGLEAITRQAVMGLSVMNQIVSLDALDDAALTQEIRRQFDLAVLAADA